MEDNLLSVKVVAKICAMGVSTVWAETKKSELAIKEREKCIEAGKSYGHIKVCFPIPKRYGKRRTRWKRSDIDEYIVKGEYHES